MRIGIDHHLGLTHAPGTGRYVRELTRGLTEIEGDFGLRLFDFGRSPRILGLERADLAPAGAPHVERRIRVPLPRRLLRPLARLGLGPERFLGGVDWFHAAIPLPVRFARARASSVLGELPSGFETDAGLARALRQSYQSLDLVFVFSSLARDVVNERLEVPPDRIEVVPVGADHWARRVDRASPPPRTHPAHLIVLGVQRPEREPLAVLRALERLARRGIEFQVSFLGRSGGACREFETAVSRTPIASRIVLRSPSELEMPQLVAAASLMIHLDRDALTAVTPLEALAAGCPVVVSESPVFREALGARGDYVSREIVTDADAFSQRMEAMLIAAADERSTADRRRFAERYTWATSAAAHVNAWRDRI